MKLPPDFMPEFGSLTGLLVDMAKEKSVDTLLDMLVERLSQRPAIACIQVWTKLHGDICTSCVFQKNCSKSRECLHLVASASSYRSSIPFKLHEGHTDLQRMPLGIGTIGQIATNGKQAVIPDLKERQELLELIPWAPHAEVASFLGQPLINNDQVLGVIAIYLSMEPLPEGIVWSRVIADHAASAIANTRAFEKIESLKSRLELENKYLREEVIEASAFGDIIGRSAAILNVIRQINLVAPTDATVLILGESGTGKELVAREIHKRSQFHGKAMIKINCASISKELYESEFFGHVKGAFTGAFKDRPGRFQAADGGTLFLDEVGEIPLELQSKLLRVLQDGSYERVGEERTRHVDVRILAATNKKLLNEVAKNQFRNDLYYRLNVFPIEVPPLRDLKEDIPLLASQFLNQTCKKMNRPKPQLTNANLAELQEYAWPGNVRELQNVIERAVITLQSGGLRFNLPRSKFNGKYPERVESTDDVEELPQVITEAEMNKRSRDNIRAALIWSNGKIYGPIGAAEILGIKPTTLCSRIKKLGLNTRASWKG